MNPLTEIIMLSSSEDEETEPPKKKSKMSSVSCDCIVLSDDDEIVSVNHDRIELVIEALPKIVENSVMTITDPTESSVVRISPKKIVDKPKFTESTRKKSQATIAKRISTQSPVNVNEVPSLQFFPKSPAKIVEEMQEIIIEGPLEVDTTLVYKLGDDTKELPPVEKVERDVSSKLEKFFEKCIEAITLESFKLRASKAALKFRRYYERLCNLNCDLRDFECMLDRELKTNYETNLAVGKFVEMFNFLKDKLEHVENEALISGPKRQHLRKLEKTERLIIKKIKYLDEQEINFDDEENSVYIQADRFKERLKTIRRKICELRKIDPHADRVMYAKLRFKDSKYPEINRAINKKYRNTLEFPTYYDMDRCLRRCVADKHLVIDEFDLKMEIKHCFEKLGNLMKRRRKQDLYDVHQDYLENAQDDPALRNPEMEEKLQKSAAEGKKKLDEIYAEYAKLQENGVQSKVSSDSDNSNSNDDEEERDLS